MFLDSTWFVMKHKIFASQQGNATSENSRCRTTKQNEEHVSLRRRNESRRSREKALRHQKWVKSLLYISAEPELPFILLLFSVYALLLFFVSCFVRSQNVITRTFHGSGSVVIIPFSLVSFLFHIRHVNKLLI